MGMVDFEQWLVGSCRPMKTCPLCLVMGLNRDRKGHMKTITWVVIFLIDMYIKCGSVLEDARRVFNRIMSLSSISWSDMILGYVEMCAKCGSIEDPWRVLTKMVT